MIDANAIHTFDRDAQFLVAERRLPHWSQAGTLTFITWRTNDSIPTSVLLQWRGERCRWLRAHQIDADRPDWRVHLSAMDRNVKDEFRRLFSDRWHDELDAGHGECVLRNPELAEIVANSLKHFDGERYVLTDFVVMPNHVHLLAAFEDEPAMLSQREAWKHFTAAQINRLLGRKGHFWEQDGFDHLVRSEQAFAYYRRYIAENPMKARLDPGHFIHFSKAMSL